MLLVEDDRELAGLLAELLADEGYETDAAYDGQRGLHLGLTGRYDVMIIDRRLPVLDGLELLARLRARAVTTRVLMLSALSTLADRVGGLDSRRRRLPRQAVRDRGAAGPAARAGPP